MSKKKASRSGRRASTSLEEMYRDNPQQLAYHKKNLLEPGLPGDLLPYEFDYVRSSLLQSPSLKRRWGFRPSAKRLSEARIRAVARDGL